LGLFLALALESAWRYAEIMAQALTTGTVPLVGDAEGVMRVSGTRVTLESLLSAFNEGATAEEIAQQYPSISLGDVYRVIGHYLGHLSELDPYLAKRRRDICETRASNESRWSPDGVREGLLARRLG
jgi:uncharacterized protein (DUF433 family)